MAGIDAVVDGGCCIGCGACAHVGGGAAATIALDGAGRFRAVPGAGTSPAIGAAAAAVCPFSGEGPDEDELAAALYPDLPVHPEIGRQGGTFAGWVEADGWRAGGSSGGLTSWIAARLLEEGMVDAVVHVRPVRPDEHGGRMFSYAVSGTVAELQAGAKSRYYPIELSAVLRQIADAPGRRFAVVGVPCFVKAVRLVARHDPAVAAGVRFTLGLVCGHLKSTGFAELLAWQCGIAPPDLEAVDFRDKLADRPASRYGFAASARDGRTVSRPMDALAGGDWGQGLFKYEACDYCDDVLAETADVAVGDAWLPGYVADSRGTNVVVARHPEILALLEADVRRGAIHLEQISADDVARSQRAGLAHRREGLAWRLAQRRAEGRWAPPRRVAASTALPPIRQRIYDVRAALAAESHDAFAEARAAGRLDLFFTRMQPLFRRYAGLYRPSFRQRVVRRLRALLGRRSGR